MPPAPVRWHSPCTSDPPHSDPGRKELALSHFLETWNHAAYTSLGLFWTAFWAFGLGYLLSALVQVFVTRERMRAAMGEAGPQSVGLGTVFGFVSSSCSFAALSTTRALFAKGAGLVPALAFLLSSTNLVVELGIVIVVFLSWQFVVGEYLGGLLLILFTWILVRATLPAGLEEEARQRARRAEGAHMHGDQAAPTGGWRERLRSREAWRQVGQAYVSEWRMVWKDVAIGFAVAGVIAAFVPASWFQTLFPGAGQAELSAGQILLQAFVGPLAAFFTFIGSMGNVPLAAVLYDNGVSFAGVMAFLFSDLVVLPVLRIQARYYGWKVALYILGVFLVALVSTALLLHGAGAALDVLPHAGQGPGLSQRDYFALDLTTLLNGVFLLVSGACAASAWRERAQQHGGESSLGERALLLLSLVALAWVLVGLGVGGAGR